jgi:hypothetical protein
MPSATPSPASKHKPSQLALDFAARMRQFDPSLTDSDLEKIAAGIDGNFKGGQAVNPKGRELKNWDEPVTVFEVPS